MPISNELDAFMSERTMDLSYANCSVNLNF
jgi:hypothetical protein